jgi:hypothetical protein
LPVPDASSIFAQLIPDWVIDQTTHLPVHPRQCLDCANYAKHVGEYTRGGALTIFIEKMREHWKEVLHEERYQREDEAYQAGLDKHHRKMERLEEELDDKDRRILALEQENDDLRRRVEELLASNARASRGGVPEGKRATRPRSRSPRHGAPRTRVSRSPSPPSNHKGKEKREAEPVQSPPVKKKSKSMFPSDPEDTDNIMDELAENTPLNSEEEEIIVETIQRSAHSHARESHRVEGEALATSSTSQMPSPFLAKGRAFKAGTRRPGPGQRPPGDLESHVGDPASFSLDRVVKDAFMSVTGHACIGKDSHWNGDAAMLWSLGASHPWFWSNGRPFQMAKEAAIVPFDQRSLAQRLAVREATRAGAIPLSDASVEPDIIHLASTNELPTYLRRDSDGRLNVFDVTAWLFLTMTQPEPVEGTVAWFWGLACHMFTTLGLFESLTKDCGGHEGASPGYVPKRFVHIGEFTAKDIARHFYDCGMTARMASTIFWDFAKGYVEQCPTAEEPAWASVLAPQERETQEHPAKRRRVHKKGNKARKQTAAPKTLAERIGEPITLARTENVPAYDEPPPAGAPPSGDVNTTTATSQDAHDGMSVDPQPLSPMGPA